MKKVFILIILLITTAAFAESGYHIINKIPIGGVGGWDLLSIDSSAHRLYISRSTHVMVIDTETNIIVGDITEMTGVHGIAIAPELNRGFISCGKTNTAVIFDLKTLKKIGQVKTGDNPDAILYEPASHWVFVFNGKSKDVTIFEAKTGLIVKTLALSGKPELAVTDNLGRVFVNLEDTNEVIELDSKKLDILKRYSIKPCVEPTGIAIDIEHNQIFSGCHNKIMTVLDIKLGKVTTTVPIGEGVDGGTFDAGTGLAFSSNGEGTLTIIHQSSGRFETEIIPTKKSARTMALDTVTHKIYLPAADFAQLPEAKTGAPKQHPLMIEDSFVILVVGNN
ncbi:MAG: YncE family protein [Nitrospirae bacterium]|nr:YncE family protein [Nitrospirota bacterium]MBF0541654.1 YncE family protein [Nitrospirota bacterium]